MNKRQYKKYCQKEYYNNLFKPIPIIPVTKKEFIREIVRALVKELIKHIKNNKEEVNDVKNN